MPTKFSLRNADAEDTKLFWYIAKFSKCLVQERVCSVIFSGATSLYHCSSWTMFGKADKKRIGNN
uniref:Uncharacterized protein n=1 Tax=Arundo donax TaxID=35708 RepID=A0A0A9EXD5_ARUDO